LRLLICAAASLGLGLAGSACSASSGKTPGNGIAMTEDRRFEPEVLTIGKGATVTFSNDSDEPHSVTAYDGRIPPGARYFSSGGFSSEEKARDNVTETLIQEGDSFELTVGKPGVYEYFCIPHESQGMKGEIVVEG
jgi:plastocyanin